MHAFTYKVWSYWIVWYTIITIISNFLHAIMTLPTKQTSFCSQELHREPVEGTPGGSGGVKGMSTQEAERTFVKIACQLDTYGVDPHPVKVWVYVLPSFIGYLYLFELLDQILSNKVKNN